MTTAFSFGYRLSSDGSAYSWDGVVTELRATRNPLDAVSGAFNIAGVPTKAILDVFPSGGEGGMGVVIIND